MSRLVAAVVVHTGRNSFRYVPGDDVPAEHAALISNPAAWADGEVPSATQPDPDPEPEQNNDPAGDGGQGTPEDLDSLDAAGLKKYAEQHGIDLQGASRKADILAAIRAAQA